MGHEMSALFEANGTMTESEMEIKVSELLYPKIQHKLFKDKPFNTVIYANLPKRRPWSRLSSQVLVYSMFISSDIFI